MRGHAAVVVAMLLHACAGILSAQEDVFKSPTAGFEVKKPSGWTYVTAERNAENLNATKLSDEEFQAAMSKYASAPLVAFAKYPEPYEDLNPSFKVNIRRLGDLKGRPPAGIINLILPALQRAFKDFQVVQPPSEVVVSGLKAAYVRVHYTLETQAGQSFPTASELWIIPRGDFFFMLGAGTRQDEKNGSRKEIAAIVDSIRIEH